MLASLHMVENKRFEDVCLSVYNVLCADLNNVISS